MASNAGGFRELDSSRLEPPDAGSFRGRMESDARQVERHRIETSARELESPGSHDHADPSRVVRDNIEVAARQVEPMLPAASPERQFELTPVPVERDVLGARESLDIARTARDIENPRQRAEQIGVAAAVERLEAAGHRAIVELGGGGPGGAMTDVLSLAPDGKPCHTEAKGTLSGLGLEQAGLCRGMDPAGNPIYELSPEWNSFGGEKVLRNLDERIEAEPDPAKRADLTELRDKEARLVEERFQDPEAYHRWVVQAGPELPAVNPDRPPTGLSRFFDTVQPDRILQCVLTGAKILSVLGVV